MSSVRDFRVLLFQLAEKLNDHDIEGIVSIEDLPASFEKQSALKVLLKLEMMGRISATKLSYLEGVLKNVERIDLVKKVKDFSRSHRKSKKSNTASASLEDQQRTLDANLEVTLVQMRIILEQLRHLSQIAVETGHRNVELCVCEARQDAEQMEKNLQYAKEHMNDDCSPDSNSTSDSSLSPPITFSPPVTFSPPGATRQRNPFEQKLVKHLVSRLSPPRAVPRVAPTMLPVQTSTADQVAPSRTEIFPQEEVEEQLYAEVVHPPPCSAQDPTAEESAYFATLPIHPRLDKGREQSSAMVTGHGVIQKPTESRGNRKKPVPPTKPKPAKLQKATSKKSTAESQLEEGGDDTGTTGDSGFSDASLFLKVNLDNPEEDDSQHGSTPAGYYKAICQKEVGGPSYYKVANRPAQMDRFQELMNTPLPGPEDTEPPDDESIYVNYPSTSHRV